MEMPRCSVIGWEELSLRPDEAPERSLSRSRYLSFLLLACGVLALAAGEAMQLLRWHHTLGYGALGLGALLTLAGAALALRGRVSAGALGRRISRLGQTRLLRGKRTRAIIVAAIIVGATLGTFVYGEYQLISSQSSGQFGLSLSVDKANEVTYQDGSIGVTVHVTAVGGVPPYTFFAVWGDHTNQTSATGNFTRVFGLAVPASTELTITAKSANSGIGYLSLLLPTQYPAVSGPVNTRTLTIVPANAAAGGQAGGLTTSTQTSGTRTFVGVINASTPTISATASSASISATSTVSGSATTASASTISSSLGFSLTVVVLDGKHQPIQGALVTLDGGTQLATDSFGRAAFANIGLGDHTVEVKLGSSVQDFPLTISPSSPSDQNMFVVL